jgi:hypothetical protein
LAGPIKDELGRHVAQFHGTSIATFFLPPSAASLPHAIS